MKIDIFPHILPFKYKEAILKTLPPAGYQPFQQIQDAFPTLTDLDSRFRIMDKQGDLVQVLTLTIPFLESIVGPSDTVKLTKIGNDELAELVKGSKAIFEARGGQKTILPEEQPVIDFAYASVVTIAPVKAGEVFSLENIWVKRPGTGAFLASELKMVLGKKASRHISSDSQVSPDDIENE